MAVSQNDVSSLSMGGDCPVQCNMHERVARDSMIACLETSVQCTGRCAFSEVGSRAPLQFQNFELHGKPGTGAGFAQDRPTIRQQVEKGKCWLSNLSCCAPWHMSRGQQQQQLIIVPSRTAFDGLAHNRRSETPSTSIPTRLESKEKAAFRHYVQAVATREQSQAKPSKMGKGCTIQRQTNQDSQSGTITSIKEAHNSQIFISARLEPLRLSTPMLQRLQGANKATRSMGSPCQKKAILLAAQDGATQGPDAPPGCLLLQPVNHRKQYSRWQS